MTWQFLQRQRVLALWRDVVRAVNSKQHRMLCFSVSLFLYFSLQLLAL